MRALLLLPVLLLAGCAVNSAYEPPIVDMTGVDPVRYNADLGACTNQRRANDSFIVLGAPISDCMAARGYTVLAKKS